MTWSSLLVCFPAMVEDSARLVQNTFVELANMLASDYDVGEFLHFLVDRCAAVVDADAAGVLLEGEGGHLRLAAAVSQEMDAIEEAEMSLGEGPCLDAYRQGGPVIAEDIGQCHERWPAITPKLLDLGLSSAYAFPLRLRGDRVGALNLYRREPGPFPEEAVRWAQAFADVAAIGILQERKVAAAERRAEQLQGALTSRIIIEQAKGVLGERHGVTPNEAFHILRRYSRNHGLKMRNLCQQVVEGTLDLSSGD